MWNAAQHSDQENQVWSLARALEWDTWPVFLSQPIGSVAILRFSWWYVLLATLIATFVWAKFIRYRIVSPALADWGALIVKLKWLTCPISAFILWQRGARAAAVVALSWPLLMMLILLLLLPILILPLGGSQIGKIQNMFMQSIGYERWEGIGDASDPPP